MAILAILLCAVGVVGLVWASVRKPGASTEASPAPSRKPFLAGSAAVLAVGVVLAALAVFGARASPTCAKAIVCCKLAANGVHEEVCDNLAKRPDADCNTSLVTFKQVVQQIRPGMIAQCD